MAAVFWGETLRTWVKRGATAPLFACLLMAGTARAETADTADACATEAERASDARDAGRIREALSGFAGCARATCPRVVRNDCREALARLREKAPRIVVRVRDQESDKPEATVSVDGAVLTAEERAQGVIVDPGTREVRATLADGRFVERKVAITISDRTRPVELVLPPPPRGPLSLGPRQQASTAEGPMTSPAVSRDRTAAYVTGGVGLGLLAAFGVLGTWTYLDYQRLDERCGAGCSASEVQGPQTRALVADVTLGASVVTLGIATVLYFTAPRSAR